MTELDRRSFLVGAATLLVEPPRASQSDVVTMEDFIRAAELLRARKVPTFGDYYYFDAWLVDRASMRGGKALT